MVPMKTFKVLGPRAVITRGLLKRLDACYVVPGASEECKRLVRSLPAPLLEVVRCKEVPSYDVTWLLIRVDPLSLIDASIRRLQGAINGKIHHEYDNVHIVGLIRTATNRALRDLKRGVLSGAEDYGLRHTGRPDVDSCYEDVYRAVSYNIDDVRSLVRIAVNIKGRTTENDVFNIAYHDDRLYSRAASTYAGYWDEYMDMSRKKTVDAVRRRAKKEEQNE